MSRVFVIIFMFMALSLPAQAIGVNRFPFRPFDDVKRPTNAEEVRISYEMLVARKGGINELEAKISALYALVEARKEIGYQLRSPRVIGETAGEWKVAIPSSFSINKGTRGPDFIVCVDKTSGKIGCFGPAEDLNQQPGEE